MSDPPILQYKAGYSRGLGTPTFNTIGSGTGSLYWQLGFKHGQQKKAEKEILKLITGDKHIYKQIPNNKEVRETLIQHNLLDR